MTLGDTLVLAGVFGALFVIAVLARAVDRRVERAAERRSAVLPPSKHAMWVNTRTGKLEARSALPHRDSAMSGRSSHTRLGSRYLSGSERP